MMSIPLETGILAAGGAWQEALAASASARWWVVVISAVAAGVYVALLRRAARSPAESLFGKLCRAAGVRRRERTALRKAAASIGVGHPVVLLLSAEAAGKAIDAAARIGNSGLTAGAAVLIRVHPRKALGGDRNA